jgi:hypothetical protein
MQHLNRFSDYDVFAYLPAGLATFAIVDLLFGTAIIINGEWDVAEGTLTIFLAYPVGQIVATPASYLLEQMAVHKGLGSPTRVMMEERTHPLPFWRKWLLSNYHRNIAKPIREKVLELATLRGWSDSSGLDQLFWYAHPIAQEDPIRYPRMQVFLNQYGLCRNLSFVSLAGAALLTSKLAYFATSHHEVQLNDAAIPLSLWFCGLLLFQRFLKFYRLYGHECLVSFAQHEDQK